MNYTQLHEAALEADRDNDRERERAAVKGMLLEDLKYPPTPDGNSVLDLQNIHVGVLADHLEARGWRWHPEKARRKKRRVNSPGVYEDACIWVGINEPDDPLADLEHMTIAEINALPPDLVVEAKRRLGMLPTPQPSQGWRQPPNITISDEPEDDSA